MATRRYPSRADFSPTSRLLIGQILHNGRPLGEPLPIIQFEHRHLVFGIDSGQYGAVLGFFARRGPAPPEKGGRT